MRLTQAKLTLPMLFIGLFLGYTLQKGSFLLLMLFFCFRVDENAIVNDYNKPTQLVKVVTRLKYC